MRKPARARLTLAEVEQLRDDFIAAAVRADRAGFDGVELHGAHGYILCQFLSSQYNQRDDRYGGSLDEPLPARVRDHRRHPGPLPPGLHARHARLARTISVCSSAKCANVVQRLLHDDRLDYVDLSLWDVFKEPNEEEFRSKPLVDWFTEPRPPQRAARRRRQDHGRCDGPSLPAARRRLRDDRPCRRSCTTTFRSVCARPGLRRTAAARQRRPLARRGPGPGSSSAT